MLSKKNQIMKILLTIFSLFYLTGNALTQTSLGGKIIEKESNEPLIFCSVALFQNDSLIVGVETDFDGVYNISNIKQGLYDIEIYSVGYPSRRISEITIEANKHNVFNYEMPKNLTLENVIVIPCGFPPIIQQDNFNKGRVFLSDEIRRFAGSKRN